MENSTPDEPGREVPYPPPSGPEQTRVTTLEAEVDALEEQLDRREQQLDDVVARYESLLAEQTRAASEPGTFVWSGAEEAGTDADPGAGTTTDTNTRAGTDTDGTVRDRSGSRDGGLLSTVRSLF